MTGLAAQRECGTKRDKSHHPRFDGKAMRCPEFPRLTINSDTINNSGLTTPSLSPPPARGLEGAAPGNKSVNSTLASICKKDRNTMPTSAPQAVLGGDAAHPSCDSRNTSHRFAHGAKNVCLVRENPTCSVPTLKGCQGLCSNDCSMATHDNNYTMAMHDNIYTPKRQQFVLAVFSLFIFF